MDCLFADGAFVVTGFYLRDLQRAGIEELVFMETRGGMSGHRPWSEIRDKMKKAAFNDACERTLLRCLGVANERGVEYSDSWALDAPTIFLDLILREIGAGLRPRAITATEKRLLRIANLCDTKLSRLGGPFKADTLDDFLNYCAALRAWLTEYVEAKG